MRRRNLLGGETIGVLTLSATGGTANASGGSTASFTVYYNGALFKNANVIVSSNQYWVGGTWQSGSSTVTLTCNSNDDLNYTRSAIITVSYKTASVTYQLTQDKGTLSLSYYDANTSGASGKTTFKILVNDENYYGGNISSNQSWATLDLSDLSRNARVTINYEENETNNDRVATITVEVQGFYRYFTLTQRYIRTIDLPYDGEVGGYKYVTVDGVKWAINNVGASFDGDYGNYYQWGAGANTFQSNVDQYYTGTSYFPSSYDTATQVMGSSWRMPTSGELESMSKAGYLGYSEIVKCNGIKGMLLRQKVFFPLAGIYWNSDTTPRNQNEQINVWSTFPWSATQARKLYIRYDDFKSMNSWNRNGGLSVRGVVA